MMKEDKQMLTLLHLSQLLNLCTGFGGLIVPLIIWLTQKDKVIGMDAHGKLVVNFQLSLLIYSLISIPLVLLLGLGFVILIVVGILSLVFPIINAIRTSNGEDPSYPFTIEIIK